jgi:hypothetical protein
MKSSLAQNQCRIYTFGYHGWGTHVPLMMRSFIKQNKAISGRGLRWVDVRFNRAVRAEGFTTGSPFLKKKNFYRYIKELGNKALREGIVINEPEKGFERLREEINSANKDGVDLILFCHCEEYAECHRKKLAKTAPMDVKKLLYKNRLNNTPEWPPVSAKTIDLTGKRGLKITSNGYIYVPKNVNVAGYSSPFVIPPGAEILFKDNDGVRRSEVVRVTPSPDEKYAKIQVK